MYIASPLCNKTPPICQYLFRWWFGAVRQHNITRTSVARDLCNHMSLGSDKTAKILSMSPPICAGFDLGVPVRCVYGFPTWFRHTCRWFVITPQPFGWRGMVVPGGWLAVRLCVTHISETTYWMDLSRSLVVQCHSSQKLVKSGATGTPTKLSTVPFTVTKIAPPQSDEPGN